MKLINFLFGVVVTITCVSCSGESDQDHLPSDLVKNPATASDTQGSVKMAHMVFSNTEHDFGTIVQGTSITKFYKFTNEGDADLIISSANGSCGCTIPKWPRTPIKPGQTGEIEVIFNSQGKKGVQTKKVYITANTSPPSNIIVLKGEVIAPE